MYEYFEYKTELDDILERLRAKYMGQDMPLHQLLPADADLSEERIAERLADIFTLYLQRTREMKDAEIKDVWLWFRAAFRFLWNCPESDRITGSILKLAELSEATRRCLELDIMPDDWAEGFYLKPPSTEDLSAVIWMMTEKEVEELERLESLLG